MRRGSRSLINGIHHNTPVAPHYRPIYPETLHCIIDESVLCIQVYYALARPVVGNREVQSIITQLGELYLQLWRQNLLILEKFFNPNWRREKIPVILERNC